MGPANASFERRFERWSPDERCSPDECRCSVDAMRRRVGDLDTGEGGVAEDDDEPTSILTTR